MDHPEGLLTQSEAIARLLEGQGSPTLVIGGVALAAHHYIRHTHLIALKLYAGGHKSKADIVELLLRNPGVDVPKFLPFVTDIDCLALRNTCARLAWADTRIRSEKEWKRHHR